MNLPPIRTLDLLIVLISALLYLAVSLAVLRYIAPALISSQSDGLVMIGFALLGVWLVVSMLLANHLINKRRAPAANTKEEDQ
ncbi:hypothetical protein K8374_09450 [Pseudomonas sp. p1(2021b)]|uniref:hypothetical protein n=1 Tax=Pseudomonas sp. p1(2021b) TaxID=2874628 RepID=UPI001CCEC02F|nr:hypothetical protein [Pseudomonas sp. p1(2021b)]UBM27155.1 hypothetical protein K8374_09450 [Pseudomonas sp. p1(2021b)]